ncbi:MAG: pentapeptide repeat-containing protein [Nostoc sp. DedQUE12a]|nr:pentapeptide repeat-containing protein [Nostoc sp. DedQUE12a]
MYPASTFAFTSAAMPQDFSHQNLRGRSFKGQDLALANFSYADIRSANFSGANLTGANFTGAKAGLQKRWLFCQLIVSLFLSGASGFMSVFGGSFVAYLVTPKVTVQFTYLPGILFFTILAVILITFVLKGFTEEGFAIVTIAVVFTIFILVFGGIFGFLKNTEAGFNAVITFCNAAGGGSGSILITIAGSILITIAGIVGGTIWIVIASIINAVVAIYVIKAYFFSSIIPIINAYKTAAIFFAILVVSSSIFIGWCALVEDKKFTLIRKNAIAFTVIGGTSFRNADLTNADFTGATLKSTDIQRAKLTRTCFYKTKLLKYVRPGTSYLQYPYVGQLLVTKQGQDKNFDYLDLRGINLKAAFLNDASFIGADLSEADLQDTDLSRAKLVQTQLDGTDFTGANLTGAYIEDWNITTDTLFDGVRCEYVYMRLPTQDNPDPHRKPDNRQEVFADGEFGDFIKPIFDTLDLYHSQGVDPRAIAISFKQLAENHPDAELEIVAMEKRGQDKFLLRAKTAIAADKSQLSAEYFATYNQLKALAEQEVKALIAEKDSRISKLETMVMTALERPSFYSNVEQVGFMTNNSSGFSVGGSVGGDINNVQGENNQQRVSNQTSSFNLQNAQFGGGLVNADTVNAQQIGGNITNYNSEQKQNLAQAAADIQQLLNQLSQSYPTATTSQRMTVVARAVDEIESNPTLKARVIGALKAGGTEAFKELIDHPLVNILLASIDGWQKAE